MGSDKIGQRNSKKRDQIVALIKEASGPLAVNDIHSLLEESGTPVGIATVYRTVKLLLETKQLTDVVFADGVVRYELSLLEHHHHFCCESCGKVFDLPYCEHKSHVHGLAEGFVVKSHEITYYGQCNRCSV